jgi:SAM-dependent methyltransferase
MPALMASAQSQLDGRSSRPVNCPACGGTLASQPALIAYDVSHGVPGRYEVSVCTSCGSATTLPFAGPAEIAGYYPDEYPSHNPRGGLLATALRIVQRARDRQFPLSALRRGAPGTLLDIGCGRGDLAASWIAAGWRVVGVEPSAEAGAVARSRGVEALIGTLDTVELSPASVDAAVFRHSLEHVPDPRLDLRRVYAALRPGGKVAIMVPNWSSWQRRAFGNRWCPLDVPRHRTHFNAAGLRAALHDAGFLGVVTRPASSLVTTTSSLQFRLFGRSLITSSAALWASYLVSIPISMLVWPLDVLLGGGDSLHAVGVRPA